jgi:DNA-binding transcriptional MerR regulator
VIDDNDRKWWGIVKEWYTIKELAEQTNIPDTSIRRYIDKFHDFFTFKGGSRSRRYEETAIKILIRIKNLFDNGYESEQVDATLRNEFPMVVDGDKEDEADKTPVLVTVEDVAELKQAQREQQEMNKLLLEKMEKQEHFNKALLEQLKNQEAYIRESLEKRDQLLLESIRTVQEEKKLLLEMAAAQEKESEKKKGFFSRLFGK